MTLNEARRLFRSLKYYEQLSRTIQQKETRLKQLISEYDLKQLDGHEIGVEDGSVRYRKLSSEPYVQLRLSLYTAEDKPIC